MSDYNVANDMATVSWTAIELTGKPAKVETSEAVVAETT